MVRKKTERGEEKKKKKKNTDQLVFLLNTAWLKLPVMTLIAESVYSFEKCPFKSAIF